MAILAKNMVAVVEDDNERSINISKTNYFSRIFMTDGCLLDKYPDWVRWVAQDASGAWWGYECEPNLYDYGWYENEIGRSIRINRPSSQKHWRDSLVQITSRAAI